MRGRRRALGVVAVMAGSLLAGGTVPAMAGTSIVDLGPDFNGDGYADVAIGVPFEDIDGVDDAGAVHVIYGTATGLNGDFPIDDQLWHQDSPGIAGLGETDDRFGTSVAAGDLDGDGFADLAVGVPYEDIADAAGEEQPDAGSVHIIHGSSDGLTAAGDVLVTQGSDNIAGSIEAKDRFGTALEIADFGDGPQEDLAIGSPGEDVRSIANAGVVDVIYGRPGGLANAPGERWHQNRGLADEAEANDGFGSALAAGDLGRGSQADLVVGIPGENVGSVTNAGAVQVIYGSSSGLTDLGDRFLHQDIAGIAGIAEAEDHFGAAVVVADLGKGAPADLAVGAPDEDAAGASNAGSVNVLYGTSAGVTIEGDQLWYQGTTNVEGDPEGGDRFGAALAAGDFGRTSHADLAIGAPYEDQEDATPDDRQTGSVNVLYGSASGLTSARDQFWWQDSPGIDGDTETNDSFGFALAALDVGRSGQADLVVGVRWESEEHTFSDDLFVGAVNVIHGAADGLTSDGDQFWWQASDKLQNSAERGDEFGSSLAR